MSLNKSITAITIEDIEALKADKFAEQQIIDYKREINLDVPQAKDEFRRDVASFANAVGGDIVIGVREVNGYPEEVCGIEIANPDGFKNRLEEILQAHIRPRVPGVAIHTIEIPDSANRFVVLVRVPRSFAKPHQVTVGKDDFQFWSRNSAGKYRLDVDQLRSVFVQSEALEERARAFRRERLGSIVAGDTPIKLEDIPKMVLHLVPLASIDSRITCDLSTMGPNSLTDLGTLFGSVKGCRHNFDGFLTYDWYDQRHLAYAYLQIFRNGIIEAVDAQSMRIWREGSPAHLPMSDCEKLLIDSIPRFLRLQRRMGVELPTIVMLSFLGTSGYAILNNPYAFFNNRIERDALLPAEVLIEQDTQDLGTLLKPIFDTIWNAAGHDKSPNYDENGNWQTHRQ